MFEERQKIKVIMMDAASFCIAQDLKFINSNEIIDTNKIEQHARYNNKNYPLNLYNIINNCKEKQSDKSNYLGLELLLTNYEDLLPVYNNSITTILTKRLELSSDLANKSWAMNAVHFIAEEIKQNPLQFKDTYVILPAKVCGCSEALNLLNENVNVEFFDASFYDKDNPKHVELYLNSPTMLAQTNTSQMTEEERVKRAATSSLDTQKTINFLRENGYKVEDHSIKLKNETDMLLEIEKNFSIKNGICI